MFCGDEVAAIVADVGSSICKFGCAGEDSPKHVFRSEIGLGLGTAASGKVFMDTALNLPSRKMEVKKLIAGDVVNWESAERLIEYGVKHMKVDIESYPILYAESHFKSLQDKMKLAEFTFESLHSSGMYIGSSAMLSSFSTGKSSSIVIDLGASKTHISAVCDGYELWKSRAHTLRGGDWIDQQIFYQIARAGNSLRPIYEMKPSVPAIKYDVTPSFRELHIYDVVRDIKRWMCFVPSQSVLSNRSEYIANLNIPPYILPDGTKITYIDDLCTVPELFFQKPHELRHMLDLPALVANDSHYKHSLSQLVYESLSSCDIDIRKDLCSSLVLVGGGALIDGLSVRLTEELSEALPSTYKAKVVTSLPIERLYGAWIGGSILSICGSFQQCWLTRKAYEEEGARIIQEMA